MNDIQRATEGTERATEGARRARWRGLRRGRVSRRELLAGTVTAVILVAAGVGAAILLTRGDKPAAGPVERPAPGTHLGSLSWAGYDREYILDAPPSYRRDRRTPLVVVLHGRPSTGSEVRSASRLSDAADPAGFLVAYPAGIGGSFSADPRYDGPDDIGFLRALVKHLVKTWNVDPARVYAAGFSAGASMSYRIAAEAGDVFSAVAPVSGPFLSSITQIKPDARVSVIAIVGTRDSFRNSIESGLDAWRDQVHCTANGPDPVDPDGKVIRTVAQCRDGSEVAVYQYQDMGHSWPANKLYGVDLNKIIVEFFATHPRAA